MLVCNVKNIQNIYGFLLWPNCWDGASSLQTLTQELIAVLLCDIVHINWQYFSLNILIHSPPPPHWGGWAVSWPSQYSLGRDIGTLLLLFLPPAWIGSCQYPSIHPSHQTAIMSCSVVTTSSKHRHDWFNGQRERDCLAWLGIILFIVTVVTC